MLKRIILQRKYVFFFFVFLKGVHMQLWHPLATALGVNRNKNTSGNTNGFEPITPKNPPWLHQEAIYPLQYIKRTTSYNNNGFYKQLKVCNIVRPFKWQHFSDDWNTWQTKVDSFPGVIQHETGVLLVAEIYFNRQNHCANCYLLFRGFDFLLRDFAKGVKYYIERVITYSSI